MDHYNIALIGKTGCGKSSTGNTILRKDIFETFAYSYTKGSTAVEKQSLEFSKMVFNVYDTPGLLNPQFTIRDKMDSLMESAKTLDAFILVYRYNMTWTSEDGIRNYEILFGKTFLEKHGIVVITHGDLLDKDIPYGKNRQQFFMDWCDRQKPGFRELFAKVKGRIVLVNNKGDFKEGSERLTASKEILEMVMRLKATVGVYTKADYEYQKRWCTIQ